MRATASNLYRLHRCQYWARTDVAWVADEGSDEARDGTQFHALAAGEDVPEASARARQLHATYEVWRDDRGEHYDVQREVVMAYDLATDTARIVPSTGARDYTGRRETEVVGTFDVVTGDGVDDLKTGQEKHCHEDQLMLGSLCWARIRNATEARSRFVFVNENFVYHREYTYDSLELDAFADQLRAWDAAIQTSEPSPGSHCRWCPASAACPAALGAMVRLQAESGTHGHRLPMHSSQIVGPDHARWVIGQLRAVKEIENTVWNALRAYVDDRGPVELGNGMVWGPKRSAREIIDLVGHDAVRALQSVLGDRWQSACSFKTSKDAIREAARGGPEPMAAVLRKALAALKAAGAVRVAESVKHEEYKVDAADEAAE